MKIQSTGAQELEYLQTKLTQRENELSDARAVITAITDLLHLQNRELRYMQVMARKRSFGKKLIYLLKHTFRPNRKALTPVPQIENLLALSHPELHPGIQVRLKKASLWQRYVVATTRKLRGKMPRNKYEVYVAAFYNTDGNAGSPTNNLAERYATILERRGL